MIEKILNLFGEINQDPESYWIRQHRIDITIIWLQFGVIIYLLIT